MATDQGFNPNITLTNQGFNPNVAGSGSSGSSGSSGNAGFSNPIFSSLNAQFRTLFLNGKEDFDYQKFLNDPMYRNVIMHQVTTDPSRQAMKQSILDQLIQFSAGGGTPHQQAGGKIDPTPFRAPLREGIEKSAAAQLRAGRGELAGGTERALTRTREGLALQGTGRSGVAAASLAGISREGAAAAERLLERIESNKAQALLAVDQSISDFKLNEELRQRGADEAFINSRQQFADMMRRIEHEHNVNFEEEDFWDFLPDIISGGAKIAAAV